MEFEKDKFYELKITITDSTNDSFVGWKRETWTIFPQKEINNFRNDSDIVEGFIIIKKR